MLFWKPPLDITVAFLCHPFPLYHLTLWVFFSCMPNCLESFIVAFLLGAPAQKSHSTLNTLLQIDINVHIID